MKKTFFLLLCWYSSIFSSIILDFKFEGPTNIDKSFTLNSDNEKFCFKKEKFTFDLNVLKVNENLMFDIFVYHEENNEKKLLLNPKILDVQIGKKAELKIMENDKSIKIELNTKVE